MLAVAFTTAAAEPCSGNVVSSEGAWCWFADPRATHYENASGTINASWLGYIDVHGSVRATQYDFVSGQRSEVLVRSYFQPDDHNNPTFLVLPDERVLIIYSRHTDERAFYYRVSTRPGDITTLGEEKKIVTTANTTYPSPFILSDDPTHFYLCWRGIGWHPTIARFTMPDENGDVTMDWGAHQIVQSTGARPYAKYASNGKDKIYLTYTTGHPDNEQPNWVYFNVVNINGGGEPTLEDIIGTRLSTISAGPFNVNKKAEYKTQYPKTVVDAPSDQRDWVWQTALDADGKPVIAMVRINGGKSEHVYHYAKWTGSEWRVTKLEAGGGKFHSSNTEYCYSGGMALDPQNVSDIYLSIPTEGASGNVFEIWKYNVAADGTVASKEQVTRDSHKNNVRPFVLPNSLGSPLRLGWMNGDYYYWMVNKNYPKGYPTDIRSDYAYAAVITQAVDTPLWEKDFANGAAAGEAITMPASGAFTVSLNVGLGTSYGAKIIDSPNLAYYVNSTDQAKPTPEIKAKGTVYSSSNLLLTSDNWAANSSGTSGDYWPTRLTDFNLTLTYDGTTLRSYRNGLIDQSIAIEGLTAADLAVAAETDCTFGRVVSYAACLNPDEVSRVIFSSALASISVPEVAITDLVLVDKAGGQTVTWTSSNPDIISTTGIFKAPEAATEVTLTATLQGDTKTFKVTAMPRNIEDNILAQFTFDPEDAYTATDGTKMVRDHSAAGRDMKLMGLAKIDGTLNLTANAADAWSTNGYGILPSDILEGLRSYTVMLTVVPKKLTGAPRFYDLGLNSGNSVFFRANALSAGIKYAGGTTTMVNSSRQIYENYPYRLAVTFDADGHNTVIYIEGEPTGAGADNVNEPYMIAQAGECLRAYIGRAQWWDNSSSAKDNRDYVGTIDDLTIYNTALTRKEICDILGIKTEDPELNVDCSDRIVNRDFEGSFAPAEGTGVESDRAIYLPEGWSLIYTAGNNYDMTILDESCLQASMFSGVPVDEGKASYRVRHKWGASTIGLKQNLEILPAAYYRLAADEWQSGSGGNVFINAEVPSTGKKGSAPSGSGKWVPVDLTFMCNGNEKVDISVSVKHYEDGKEMFAGFDNVTLYDVTANRTEKELVDLLAIMIPAAQARLATMEEGDARLALEEAVQIPTGLDETAGFDTLYEAYVKLRDALAAANTSGIGSIAVDRAAGSAYDLNGRRVNAADVHGAVIIVDGQKILK